MPEEMTGDQKLAEGSPLEEGDVVTGEDGKKYEVTGVTQLQETRAQAPSEDREQIPNQETQDRRFLGVYIEAPMWTLGTHGVIDAIIVESGRYELVPWEEED